MALYVQSAKSHHEYLHQDHLGSLVAITGDSVLTNADVQWFANGAWGERRFQQWNGPLDPGFIPASTAHGFTDHEHLDSVGLIHMNGRVYDPELGRFLSADPLVQEPHNSQSYNRYSYVFNNPLSYTDPSGFTAEASDDDVRTIDVTGIRDSCGSTLCGADAWNYGQDWQNQRDRWQDGFAQGGGFWNGAGSIGLAVVDQVAIEDLIATIDDIGNGNYLGAAFSVALVVAKPLKAADLVKDAVKNADKIEKALDVTKGGSTYDLLKNAERTKSGLKVDNATLQQIGAAEAGGGKGFSGLSPNV